MNVPDSWYVIIGTLVVANLGTVVSVLYGVGKAIWWASQMTKRVEFIETDHKDDINAAFQKIRELERKGEKNVNCSDN